MKIASSIANFMCALYLKSNYLARSSIQIFFMHMLSGEGGGKQGEFRDRKDVVESETGTYAWFN